ncbi:MAG: PGF-CTERM sorting domain-containing protein [Methanothrix sp.]
MKKALLILVSITMLFAAFMTVNASEDAAEESNASAAVAEETHEAASAHAENVAEAAEEKTVEDNKTAEAAHATEEKKEQPGFEGVFALAGLLAVAFLAFGKRA